MGIISSKLECCWSEMGFHLLKSCRLYTLSLQEFGTDMPHTASLCLSCLLQWRCRSSLWCVVFALSASPCMVPVSLRGKRSVSGLAIAHWMNKMFTLLVVWPTLFFLFQIYTNRTSINTPSGCNIVFFLLKEWCLYFLLHDKLLKLKIDWCLLFSAIGS